MLYDFYHIVKKCSTGDGTDKYQSSEEFDLQTRIPGNTPVFRLQFSSGCCGDQEKPDNFGTVLSCISIYFVPICGRQLWIT
ncbi:hypothetical protein Nepgr_013606 [Nepenthes gracilis]|uniref:Uncharacterized protein n=1 Tax=Nepenthes gracilis TaxID=150966 RepID=A0AAD3SHS6_NEPGR|nr:hypothetical protein Nepgr_013606 [Nepenthes gracilis]